MSVFTGSACDLCAEVEGFVFCNGTFSTMASKLTVPGEGMCKLILEAETKLLMHLAGKIKLLLLTVLYV